MCLDPAEWVTNMNAVHATIRFAVRFTVVAYISTNPVSAGNMSGILKRPVKLALVQLHASAAEVRTLIN